MTNKEFETGLSNIFFETDTELGYFPTSDMKQLIIDLIGMNEQDINCDGNPFLQAKQLRITQRNELRDELRKIVKGEKGREYVSL
jgi:hypothetical protein